MANLMPLPKMSFSDSNGRPLVGGKVFFYDAGTSTPKNTFTDATGATPNANPVILDARGEASIWLLNGLYKVKLCTQTGVEVWTADNVSNKGDASIIDFKQAGTGAVARTAQDKMRERVTPEDFGAVGDGVYNDSIPVSNWLQYLIDNGCTGWMLDKTYRVGSQISKSLTGFLRIVADPGAVLKLDAAIFLQSPTVLTTALSSDVARKAIILPLTSVVGIQVGDIVRLSTNTSVEASFGYKKQCIRRVASISGSTVYIDQPLDFFFTTAESTVVTVIRPGTFELDGGRISASTNCFLRLDGAAGSSFRNGCYNGPGPYNTTNTDAVILNYCDSTSFDKCWFVDSRYLPNINTGSRYTKVTNSYGLRIRHIDPNTWAQDTLIEDCVGISTETLIQSHPSIRTTIRRCRDMNTDAALGGLNMRGLGDIVEDCEAYSMHGSVIYDTGGTAPLADYVSMYQDYTRRYTRFKSPTAGINARYQGEVRVEDCEVPGIQISGSTFQIARLLVDAKTRGWGLTEGFNEAAILISMQNAANKHVSDRGPVRIPTLSEGGFTTLAVRGYPAIGWFPKKHYSAQVYASTSAAGVSTVTIPLKFRHEHATPQIGYRYGLIRVVVGVSDAVSVYEFAYRTFLGNTSIAAVTTGAQVSGTSGTATVTLSNVVKHFLTEVTAEAGNTNDGNLYYFTADLAVTIGGTTRVLRTVEIEVEECHT